MKPLFFATPDEFGAWLEEHHETATELLVGFHKKGSGRPSITWPESVEQALRFGWIDGVRRSLGDESYTIRFTPRRPKSNWSAVNVAKVEELEERGLMAPAGVRAYEARTLERTGIYSHERRDAAVFPPHFEERLRANPAAWEWFEGRPQGYRSTATHWVVSAKRDETRLRRLQQLIDCSAEGRNVPPLAR
ncbi:MAG: YdeI/OmpD-associated family protein [Thermoleophilaceae bacterium]|nr:YdeI/OmpD-associated family protein [Thermoleophilaceae bacterium]